MYPADNAIRIEQFIYISSIIGPNWSPEHPWRGFVTPNSSGFAQKDALIEPP